MQLIQQKDTTQRAKILFNLLQELGFGSIKAFQKAHHLEADGLFGIRSYNRLYSRLLKVVELTDFEGAYFRQVFPKRQIVLHHSAGWDNARQMFDIWKRDSQFHVATAIGITDDGTVTRGYDEQFWAFHIGLGIWQLEQQSIGVEICNWGALEHRDGQYFTWVADYGKRGRGVTIPQEKAIELNYKGIRFYEIYTDHEINALKYWILLNALRFDIPLAYSEKDMWEISQKAISGQAGIYTHNSYVAWKSDISPQPKVIAMLQELARYAK